jgi:hypothetical protein
MPRRFVHTCQSFTGACCLLFQSNPRFLHSTSPGKQGMFQELFACIIKTFSDFKHPEVQHPYSRETSLIWSLWIHFTPFYLILRRKHLSQYFEAIHSVHSCTQPLLLFQIIAHNMLNTYTYHHLPPAYLVIPYCCISFDQLILGVPIVVN